MHTPYINYTLLALILPYMFFSKIIKQILPIFTPHKDDAVDEKYMLWDDMRWTSVFSSVKWKEWYYLLERRCLLYLSWTTYLIGQTRIEIDSLSSSFIHIPASSETHWLYLQKVCWIQSFCTMSSTTVLVQGAIISGPTYCNTFLNILLPLILPSPHHSPYWGQ